MRVALIHWNADEAAARAKRLREAGFVTAVCATGAAASPKHLRESKPEAIVIDLSRLPSHGRMIATMIRQSKALRHVPIVFVDGADEKVAAVKKVLPDATYTTWSKIKTAIKGAVAHPPVAPIVPKELSYSETPVVKKLAIKAGARVLLIDAPAGFVDNLGELPDGASFVERGAGDMVIWFTRNAGDFEADIERVVRLVGASPLWIASPRSSAASRGGLTQAIVRDVAVALGLVDYKVCSIDATWSALLFKTPRDAG